MRALQSLPLIFALPLTAAYADGFVAEPLPADYPIPANSLVIEYQGTISAVSDAPEYGVGDRISGRLLVDLTVPWHASAGSGNSRTYGSGDPDSSGVSGFPGATASTESLLATSECEPATTSRWTSSASKTCGSRGTVLWMPPGASN